MSNLFTHFHNQDTSPVNSTVNTSHENLNITVRVNDSPKKTNYNLTTTLNNNFRVKGTPPDNNDISIPRQDHNSETLEASTLTVERNQTQVERNQTQVCDRFDILTIDSGCSSYGSAGTDQSICHLQKT